MVGEIVVDRRLNELGHRMGLSVVGIRDGRDGRVVLVVDDSRGGNEGEGRSTRVEWREGGMHIDWLALWLLHGGRLRFDIFLARTHTEHGGTHAGDAGARFTAFGRRSVCFLRALKIDSHSLAKEMFVVKFSRSTIGFRGCRQIDEGKVI